MRNFAYKISDEIGIHARPAGMLAKEAKKYSSEIMISYGGKSVNVTRMMAVMAMAVKKGMEVTISAEGEDEDTAIACMEAFFRNNL